MKGISLSFTQDPSKPIFILFLLLIAQSCGPGKEKDQEGKEGSEKDHKEQKTDLEERGLKGKVEKLSQRKYTAKGSKEDPKKGKRVGPAFENFDIRFNEAGMRTQELWYDSTGQPQRKVSLEYKNGTNKKKRTVSRGGDSARSRTVWTYDKDGFISEKIKKGGDGKVEWKVSYGYDSLGQKTKTVRKTPDGDKLQEVEIERNEKGWITGKKHFNSAGALERKTHFVRDEKGRVARKTDYDKTGRELGRFTFAYNQDGQRTEVKKFAGNGKLKQWRTYSYNDKDDPVREEHRNADGEVTQTVVYRYRYDEKGNWTRRVTLMDGKPYRITERSYSYR